jgi:hypothetical protein
MYTAAAGYSIAAKIPSTPSGIICPLHTRCNAKAESQIPKLLWIPPIKYMFLSTAPVAKSAVRYAAIRPARRLLVAVTVNMNRTLKATVIIFEATSGEVNKVAMAYAALNKGGRMAFR